MCMIYARKPLSLTVMQPQFQGLSANVREVALSREVRRRRPARGGHRTSVRRQVQPLANPC
jgi:hypothetical protein